MPKYLRVFTMSGVRPTKVSKQRAERAAGAGSAASCLVDTGAFMVYSLSFCLCLKISIIKKELEDVAIIKLLPSLQQESLVSRLSDALC